MRGRRIRSSSTLKTMMKTPKRSKIKQMAKMNLKMVHQLKKKTRNHQTPYLSHPHQIQQLKSKTKMKTCNNTDEGIDQESRKEHTEI